MPCIIEGFFPAPRDDSRREKCGVVGKEGYQPAAGTENAEYLCQDRRRMPEMFDDLDEEGCVERFVSKRDILGRTADDGKMMPNTDIDVQGLDIDADRMPRGISPDHFFEQDPLATTDIDDAVSRNPAQDGCVPSVPIPAADSGFCILVSLENHPVGGKVGMNRHDQSFSGEP